MDRITNKIKINNVVKIILDKEHYHITTITTVKDNPFLKNGDYAFIMEFGTFKDIDKSKYIHDGSIVRYELDVNGQPNLVLLKVGKFKTETILYPLSQNVQIDPILIKNNNINQSHITGVLMFSIHDFANLLPIK